MFKLYGAYSRDDVIRIAFPGGFTEHANGDVLAADDMRALFVTTGQPPAASYFPWRNRLQWIRPVEDGRSGKLNFWAGSARQQHLFVRPRPDAKYAYAGLFTGIGEHRLWWSPQDPTREKPPAAFGIELKTPLSDTAWKAFDWTHTPFVILGMELPMALKQAVAAGRWRFPSSWDFNHRPKFLLPQYVFLNAAMLLPDEMYCEAHNKPWKQALCFASTGTEEMLLFLDYSVSPIPRVTTPGNWGWHVITETIEEFLPMIEA